MATQFETRGHGQDTDTLDARDEDQLVRLARDGDESAIRTIIRRHNQRLFRAARAIVRSDSEAEDVVQASYVKAFTRLESFRGDSRLTTWLTRITINEALTRQRSRRRRPTTSIEETGTGQLSQSAQVIPFPGMAIPLDPEAEMSRNEVRRLLEGAIDGLPPAFRSVFVLRDVEGLSTEEVASQLGIRPETVKTRLFRARRLMRTAIARQMNDTFTAVFPFDGERCVNMADRVLAELARQRRPDAS